jgi:protein O-mannosyl-transferase
MKSAKALPRKPAVSPSSRPAQSHGGSSGAGGHQNASAGKRSPWVAWAGGMAAALLAALWAYGPALDGAFVFDDPYLPFMSPGAAAWTLHQWLNGVRPLLMLSFWFNFQISGTEPWTYHVVNVVLHTLNAGLVYLITARLLARVETEPQLARLLAVFAGGLFLLHPVQTESVAYVASRSEVLSVGAFLGAYCVFLYRTRDMGGIGWAGVAAVLVLFGLAVLTKEHAVVLPGLLLLTDYFFAGFSLAGIRRNWRLYVLLAIGSAAGGALVYQVLKTARTAGFGMKDLRWYEYFYTQCRVLWSYFRLFVVPYPLNIDPDVAISRSPFDHGAIIGMIALAGLIVAAWLWRRRLPLASFGMIAALLLLAPTSSLAPLRDPMAEHRLYLPFFALTLVVIEFVRRLHVPWRTTAASLAALLLLFGVMTYRRSAVWADPIALWQDSIHHSPRKARPRFQLAYAYYQAGQPLDAVREFDTAATLDKPDVTFLLDWALAYDAANRPAEALSKLSQAAEMEPTAHIYATIGLIEGKQNHRQQALAALDQAEKLDPKFDMTYAYRGNVLFASGDHDGAIREYRRALDLNPTNPVALKNLPLAITAAAAQTGSGAR